MNKYEEIVTADKCPSCGSELRGGLFIGCDIETHPWHCYKDGLEEAFKDEKGYSRSPQLDGEGYVR